MEFESLVQIEKEPRSKPMVAGLGCAACPAKPNWKRGINPIKTSVRGKKLMVIGQSPGYADNADEKALVGDSGDFFWKELKKVGLRRKDVDVQYAVRCMTTDGKDEDTGRWKNRQPNKDEIKCCSKYTVRAIRKSRAKVYVIFGDIAAKQVCGPEFKKGQKIFWSNALDAKVYVLDHPYSFLRGGSSSRLTQFRVSLAAAAAEVTGKHKGDPRYAAFEKQDYKWITTVEEAEAEARLIRRAGAKGIRVSFDGEDDYLDKYKTRMPLNMSTCFVPGRARNFLLYYPGIKVQRSVRKKIMAIVASLLNDPSIPKVMHHGISDDNAAKRDFGVSIKNFHFDTEYSSFFKDPAKKSFGLKKLVDSELPEFSGYESVIIPWAIPKELPVDEYSVANVEFRRQALANLKASQQQQYTFYRKRGMLRYSQIPEKQFNLYACGDADFTKRLERKTKDVSLPLLDVYVDSAWVLNKMEHNGPIFDFEHHKKLTQIYPPRLEAVKKKIAKIAGPDFNPASGAQVKHFVYDVLKIKYPFPPKRGIKDNNTRKETMEFLGRKHKFCKLISIFRKLAKMVSTYLDSFEKCAIANYGRLRTKWWLTGTQTGRLSSGGTKDESVDVVINLQNVHGDEQLQNQAVGDKHWRKCYDFAVNKMKKVVGTKLFSKVAKYADNPAKLYDKRDETGKVTHTGYLTKIKTKLKKEAWQIYAEEIIEKYGNTKIFLGFDFGQIEVRILAQLSGDKNLIEDCKSGDIHSKVGHAMTGWAIEMIKKDKKTRTLTKNIHFGIMYGLSPAGVYQFIRAKDPDITVTEADVAKMYEAYFKRYPGVRTLTDELRKMAEDKGYVENMFGFRRPLNANDNGPSEEDGESTGDVGAYWGNQAINTPIQGAAHHLMLMAVAALRKYKKKYLKLLGIPTMEVHDALYFFIKLKNLTRASKLGKHLLEVEPLRAIKKNFPKVHKTWDMPLMVEGKAGLRLGDTVETEGLNAYGSLAEMVLETYVKECVLELEMARAA